MKDYERYMNRQKMSNSGMEKLLRLEMEQPKKTYRPPQWLKYAGAAACLCLAVGLVALPAWKGIQQWAAGRLPGVLPLQPEEEVYFNEVVSVPFTDQAIAGGMGLNEIDAAQAAELFGCAPDDFPGFLESMGLGEYDMEYYTIDMDADPSNDDSGFRFLMKGDYLSYVPDPLSSFMPRNSVWLEIYEGHSYLDEEAWQVPVVAYNDTSDCQFTPCEINGHKVVAAAGKENDWYAAAAFDMESGGKEYGVFYSATTYGDSNAKELVSKLVNCLTDGGVFPKIYDGNDIGILEYEKLAVFTAADGTVGEEGDVNRELTVEELEKVFPACAGEADYQWRGNARLSADGALRQLSIRGTRWDGTAQINLEAGDEAEIFYLWTEKDGKTVHPGVENPVPQGVDLLRCYYRTYPEYYWWWDGETLANAVDCTCQYKPTGSKMVSEITTFVKNGTLENNEEFNTEWVKKVMDGGICLSSETVDGKEVWRLPETNETVFDRSYSSLAELRGAVEEKFLPYLPTAESLPDYDEFTGYWIRNGSGAERVNERVSARWHKPWVIDGSYARFSYGGDVEVTWPAQENIPAVTDITDRESYDFRLYPDFEFTNDGREPVGLEAKLKWPAFRAADASLDLVESRIYHVDENNTECRFCLLHDDGALVQYLFQGMTAEEIWRVVEPSLPLKEAAELSGEYVMMPKYGEEVQSSPRVTLREDGTFGCFTSWVSSHLCEGRYSCRDGRLIVSCGKHHYEFEVEDGERLRFVAADSGKWEHYTGCPEVTDGAEFMKLEEGKPWEDYKIGVGVGHDTHSETHHAEDSPIVPIDSLDWDNTYVELDISAPTHHPEPTHHPDRHH